MKLCCILVVFVFGICCSLENPEVTIEQGRIVGKYMKTISNRRISVFLGIPYAKPPVGNLRFNEPEQPTPWKGFLNATRKSMECLQYSQIYYETEHPVHGSEDCLYLNIFVPKIMNDEKLLDVLFFIHGGGFMWFSSAAYGPEYLLDRDIILVTVNYRVGVLGFLSTEDSTVPGNNGLKDQQMALKWVHDNIKNFGGDPDKVTIAGLSAGGASVHYHILSPNSKGLFHRAILLSGSAFCHWAQAENSRQKTQVIAGQLGCPTHNSQEMVDCLKERPGDQIVGLTKLFQTWHYNPFSPFGPVVEPPNSKSIIDGPPEKIIKSKSTADVPILFSVTSDEGLYPGSEFLGDFNKMDSLENNWVNIFPHLLDFNFTLPLESQDLVSKKIREYYIGKSIKKNLKGFINMMSDRMFNIPVSQAALLHAHNQKSPVYSMQFSYVGKYSLSDLFKVDKSIYKGTSHADDLMYILRTDSLTLDDDEESLAMSKRMISIWMDFIKHSSFSEKWVEVKENLPYYSFMNVKGADRKTDEFEISENFGEVSFWKSLGIKEFGFTMDSHDEL